MNEDRLVISDELWEVLSQSLRYWVRQSDRVSSGSLSLNASNQP